MINNFNYKNFVENIISSLEFGDIIYAKRYDTDEQKLNMFEGHDKGPYVVIGFNDSKIIGVSLTSDGKERGTIQICENNNQFNRSKKSYIYIPMMKSIDYKAFIYKYNMKLNSNDLNKLKKMICFNNLTYYDNGSKRPLNLDINVDLEIGDIVTVKKTPGKVSVVIDKTKDGKYLIIPCIYYKKNTSYIDFSQVKIDYFNASEAKKDELLYLNTLNSQQLKKIRNDFYEYLKNNSHITNSDEKKLAKGCLVNISRCIFYVYDVEGNVAHSFCVIHVAAKNSHIRINNKSYLPFYDSIKDICIDLDSYKLLAVATETEKEKIEENRNNYLTTYNYETDNTMVGKVVCPKRNSIERYLVLEDKEETYKIILLSSLVSRHNIDYRYIPKTSVIEVKDITSEELCVIKNYLEQLYNKNDSKEVVKKLTL